MKTKKDRQYSYNHMKQRLSERYSVKLTMSEYDVLCHQYIADTVEIVDTDKSNDQIIFKTMFKNKIIKFVWCNKRKRITTAIK